MSLLPKADNDGMGHRGRLDPPEGGRSWWDLWPHALALLALPLAAHLSFSQLGFNPTDDGFILAYSRRLLDGQIPHRDFISIRPVGSALLHTPELLFGGTHTFWISRLAVWFEFALIAWAWTRAVGRITRRPSTRAEILLGTLVAFVMSSFTFPVMPWHTIDALMLASLGLLLACSSSERQRALGYALLGSSALCRQNFLPVAPLVALVMGHRRDRWAGIAAIAPAALYGGFLVVHGALGPALEQMRSQLGLEETGVRAYVSVALAGGLVAGALSAVLNGAANGHNDPVAARWKTFLGPLIAWALVIGSACAMMNESSQYLRGASFALFGAVLGQTLATSVRRGVRHPSSRVGWLALLVAWCASISIGLNSPALAAGPLVAVLLGPTWELGVLSSARSRSATRFAVTVGLAAALVLVWGTARFCLIYRDGPYTEVNQPLDHVLAGGAGLRTNPRTFALMSDLKRAVSLTEGRPYAVVADFPAHWARAERHNPLSIDWPQSTELNTPALRARVIGDLEALRAGGCIVAQNVAAGPFAERSKPIEDDSYYFVLAYVRTHFRKIASTRWFDLYE